MALTVKTISTLITDVRLAVDEPFDSFTNLWTNTFILRALNQGFRQVWQVAREDKRSLWFLRRLKSTDSPLTIFGVSYDPVVLKVVSGVDKLVMPPDCGEIKLFESLPNLDGVLPGVTFRFTDISSPAFRAEVRTTVAGAAQAQYWADLVYRETGPELIFAPQIAVETETDTIMEYIIVPGEHPFFDDITNTLATSGFDDFLLDAVVAYASWLCSLKSEDTGLETRMSKLWNDKATLIRRRVGPHQSQDPELVHGDFEDEIDSW